MAAAHAAARYRDVMEDGFVTPHHSATADHFSRGLFENDWAASPFVLLKSQPKSS